MGQRSPIVRFFCSHIFLCFFQYTVKYPSNALPPSYMTHTSSRTFRSFHTSYRVCLVPAESDRNGVFSADAVAARRQNGVAVPHRGHRLEIRSGNGIEKIRDALEKAFEKIDTIIQLSFACLHSSPFVKRGVLKLCLLNVFHPSVSPQLVRAGIRTAI